jgi:hypothetical protein
MSARLTGLLGITLGLWACTVKEGPAGGSGSETGTPDTADAPLPTSTARRVLHEVFTGSNCGPCLGADGILDDIFHETATPYSVIKYQIGSDPYMTREGVSRRMYYLPGEEVYAIPYVHADGETGFHPAQLNDDAGYTEADLAGFAEGGSPLSLTVTHSISEQTVDLTIAWTTLSDISSDDLVIHAAIIENITTGNVGSNGQAEFHQVMKKMVPDNLGTSMSAMTRADQGELALSYTFNGEYNGETSYSDIVDHDTEHTVEEFSDLEVIVWVQDSVTWEVFQSAWTIE